MMNQPFSGIGYTGYDNFNKKYVSFWIDNMSTGMSTMDGKIDKDNDTHVFEVYDVTAYGDKKPTMQITYTRKKS